MGTERTWLLVTALGTRTQVGYIGSKRMQRQPGTVGNEPAMASAPAPDVANPADILEH